MALAGLAVGLGEIDADFLHDLAAHIIGHVHLPVAEILELEGAGGEIDSSGIDRLRPHADGDQRAVAGDKHGVGEGMAGVRSQAVAPPVHERRVAHDMAASRQTPVAIGKLRQERHRPVEDMRVDRGFVQPVLVDGRQIVAFERMRGGIQPHIDLIDGQDDILGQVEAHA